jgi:undecaprenyl-diphosphatase
MVDLLERLDHQLFFLLNLGLSMSLLDHLMWWVSFFGDGVPLTVAVGIVLWRLDRQAFRQHYLWLVVAVVGGALMVQALKYGFARPRPLNEFAALLQAGTVHINVIGHPLRYRSFPSGHAQAAATVFMYLVYMYPRYWCWWGAGAVLIGLSRIHLGVHFPFDVLTGLLLGSLWATGVWRLRQMRRAEGGMGNSDNLVRGPLSSQEKSSREGECPPLSSVTPSESVRKPT